MKKYLIVFLISMVPLIELRGAIPYAVGFNLPTVPSYMVAVLGTQFGTWYQMDGPCLSRRLLGA